MICVHIHITNIKSQKTYNEIKTVEMDVFSLFSLSALI